MFFTWWTLLFPSHIHAPGLYPCLLFQFVLQSELSFRHLHLCQDVFPMFFFAGCLLPNKGNNWFVSDAFTPSSSGRTAVAAPSADLPSGCPHLTDFPATETAQSRRQTSTNTFILQNMFGLFASLSKNLERNTVLILLLLLTWSDWRRCGFSRRGKSRPDGVQDEEERIVSLMHFHQHNTLIYHSQMQMCKKTNIILYLPSNAPLENYCLCKTKNMQSTE